MLVNILESYIHNFKQFIYAIGYFGEYIEFILVFSLLFYKTDIFIVFIIGYVSSIVLNGLLKEWIHQKRPSNSAKFLNNEQTNKNNGMPSGHGQNTFYCITFLFLCRKMDIWNILSLFVGLTAVYQRWIFHNHTIEQILTGMAIGFVIGNIFYYGHKFLVK